MRALAWACRIKPKRFHLVPAIAGRGNGPDLIRHQILEMQRLRDFTVRSERPLPRRERNRKIGKGKSFHVVRHGDAELHFIAAVGHDSQRIARRVILVGSVIGVQSAGLAAFPAHAMRSRDLVNEDLAFARLPIR